MNAVIRSSEIAVWHGMCDLIMRFVHQSFDAWCLFRYGWLDYDELYQQCSDQFEVRFLQFYL